MIEYELCRRLKGLAKDEVLIYQLIQQSSDKGIWTKDMKTRSNVPHTRLPKILKMLESRNLIKSVKSLSGGNRKIYMLYELQPSEDLTGGTWWVAGSDFFFKIKLIFFGCFDPV